MLREQGDALTQAIGLTPFSRAEFEAAITEPREGLSNLERARRFYILARQVRTGLAQKASSGRWAHCKLTSRAGMAGAVSRWLGAVEDLPLIAQRLLRVQIEHAPAIEVIQRYDSEETLFYCDPPYPHSSRTDVNAYANEMTDQHHRALAEVLRGAKGNVAVSGYDCDLMKELYGDWRRVESKEKIIHSVKSLRTEVLWMNYQLEEMIQCPPLRSHRQASLI